MIKFETFLLLYEWSHSKTRGDNWGKGGGSVALFSFKKLGWTIKIKMLELFNQTLIWTELRMRMEEHWWPKRHLYIVTTRFISDHDKLINIRFCKTQESRMWLVKWKHWQQKKILRRRSGVRDLNVLMLLVFWYPSIVLASSRKGNVKWNINVTPNSPTYSSLLVINHP